MWSIEHESSLEWVTRQILVVTLSRGHHYLWVSPTRQGRHPAPGYRFGRRFQRYFNIGCVVTHDKCCLLLFVFPYCWVLAVFLRVVLRQYLMWLPVGLTWYFVLRSNSVVNLLSTMELLQESPMSIIHHACCVLGLLKVLTIEWVRSLETKVISRLGFDTEAIVPADTWVFETSLHFVSTWPVCENPFQRGCLKRHTLWSSVHRPLIECVGEVLARD